MISFRIYSAQYLRKQVMVVVPKRWIVGLLLGKGAPRNALDRLADRLYSHLGKTSDDPVLLELLLQVCRRVLLTKNQSFGQNEAQPRPATEIQQSSLPLDQNFVHSLVGTYIEHCVGKEPEKPIDWARPEEVSGKCVRECYDCRQMNEFLMNPKVTTHELSCKDDWHLMSEFHNFVYFETESIDHTPVSVTKTLKWWEERHQEWEVRALTAQKNLRKLPQTELKKCLDDKYDEIVELRTVKVEYGSARSTNADEGKYLHETTSTVPQKRLLDESS